MIFLRNDYSMGACHEVMRALIETNDELTNGYGEDRYCAKAAERICERIDCPEADVHFLMGGTQTNLTALSAFLTRSHYSVISADTGHICVHETGSIEATGHKVIHVPTPDGKLKPLDIDGVMAFHENEHYVLPKAVYISDSTETGLVYTKAELMALREACDRHDLLLYLDGARMAMALTSDKNDVKFEDFPKIADAFYIGGTKCGAMFGEALVIVNDKLKPDMRYVIKQHGGMLAKGRLLGVQFDALMKEGLYTELGAHANEMAKVLKNGIESRGYTFAVPPETNILFPMFPKELIVKLKAEVEFEPDSTQTETHACIRLVTSWATTKKEINEFLKLI